jgi:hypothetical protein
MVNNNEWKNLSTELTKQDLNNLAEYVNQIAISQLNPVNLPPLLEEEDSEIVRDLKAEITRLKGELNSVEKKRQDSLLGHISDMIDEKEKKRSLTPIKADLISRLIENNVDKNKVSELIGIKRMFLNKRIEEIKKLREICENLERVSNKHEKWEDTGKCLSAVGKIIENWSPVKAVEPIGDLVTIYHSNGKRKFTIKSGFIFQRLLKDEVSFLEKFESVYAKALESIFSSFDFYETKLFMIRYKVYDVATNIWENKVYLKVDDIKMAIDYLWSNGLALEDEIVQEEQSLESFLRTTLFTNK